MRRTALPLPLAAQGPDPDMSCHGESADPALVEPASCTRYDAEPRRSWCRWGKPGVARRAPLSGPAVQPKPSLVDGYAAIQPLALAFLCGAHESPGTKTQRGRYSPVKTR